MFRRIRNLQITRQEGVAGKMGTDATSGLGTRRTGKESMMGRYIGIDPGVSGGMAYMVDLGEPEIELVKFKDATERDICDAIMRWTYMYQSFVVIEKVASSPQMGVVSAFTFGRSYGFLRGLLTGRAPFEEVSPQKWQKFMGCQTKGDKNVSKARAQQLFPQLKITHATADALLLAEYARRNRVRDFQLTP